MERNELQLMTGRISQSINELLKRIDANSKKILYIVDEENHLLGSISDGDIRRWLLKNGKLDGTAADIINKNTIFLTTAEAGRAGELMKKNELESIPIIDQSNKLIDIIFINDSNSKMTNSANDSLKSVPVIVMAGGKGTRLYPYTKILPKPLIPIGDVPILERIFSNFNKYGADRFYLTVNYKKEMIKSYFGEYDLPYRIIYIEESIPLGTAGGISLIEESFDTPIIITNCDTLIDADYTEILDYHKKANNDMTIVSSMKNLSVQYGVIYSKEGGVITSMEEKPERSFFINTGMYFVNPQYLKWIPKGKKYNMTDLANRMIEQGAQVGMYPITWNSFLDMGQFEEMDRAESILRQINGI